MTVEIHGIPAVPAGVAAEELRTTQLKVLMLIKQKALCGEMINGEWYVTRESLFSYDPEGQKPAEKHECRSGCGGCH